MGFPSMYMLYDNWNNQEVRTLCATRNDIKQVGLFILCSDSMKLIFTYSKSLSFTYMCYLECTCTIMYRYRMYLSSRISTLRGSRWKKNQISQIYIVKLPNVCLGPPGILKISFGPPPPPGRFLDPSISTHNQKCINVLIQYIHVCYLHY